MNNLLQPDKKSVAQRIRIIKDEWDVSLTEMGNRLGIAKPTMNSYVQGYSLPPKEIIEKLSTITSKPVEWFYYGEPSDYIQDYLTLNGHGALLKEFPQIPSQIAREYVKKIQDQTINSSSLYPDEDIIDLWFPEYYDEAMSQYLFRLAKEFVQKQEDCPPEQKEEVTSLVMHELYDTFNAIGYYEYGDEQPIQDDIKLFYNQRFQRNDPNNLPPEDGYLVSRLITILKDDEQTSFLIEFLSKALTDHGFSPERTDKELIQIFQSMRPKLIEIHAHSTHDDYYDWFEK